MSRNAKLVGRWMAIAVAIGLVCFSQALAKKPEKPPAGGGDNGPSYQIIRLDDWGSTFTGGFAHDINDDRQIVGSVRDPLAGSLAACWTTSETNGEVQSELHLLAGGTSADGINQWGEIVGEWVLDGQRVGLYWPDKNAADPLVLLPLAGDDQSNPSEINDDGLICGASTRLVPRVDQNGNPYIYHEQTPVVWRIDADGSVIGPFELSTDGFEAYALAISNNDADGVARVAGKGIGQGAVVWTVDSNDWSGQHEILDAGAVALGVNNLGEICGTDDDEAIVWAGGSSQVLNRAKWVWDATAFDISDNGVIVGDGYYQKNARPFMFLAVVWPSEGGSMIVLEDFLDRDSPFVNLHRANAINGAGEIVGSGWNGSAYGAFLAIPK